VAPPEDDPVRRLFLYVLLVLGACAPTVIAAKAMSAPAPEQAPQGLP